MKLSQDPIEVNSLSAIDHVLRHAPKKVRSLATHVPFDRLSGRAKEILQLAKSKGIRTDTQPKSTEKTSENVTAFLDPFDYQDLKPFLETHADSKNGVVILLDHLQDPQNFGALARTAEALGAQALIIPKDRSVNVTAGVYHASVGAVETIPIILVQNVGEALRKLKEAGYWAVGSSLGENAKSLGETPSFEKVALVLGSELEGMSSLMEKTCDWLVQIPLSGKVQSMNVSAAGAILIHHFTTQKG